MQIKFPSKNSVPEREYFIQKVKDFLWTIARFYPKVWEAHPKYFSRWLETKRCRARGDGEPSVTPGGGFSRWGQSRAGAGQGGAAGGHRPGHSARSAAGLGRGPSAAPAAAPRRGREQSPRCPAAAAGPAAPAPRSPCPEGAALAGPPGSAPAAAAQSGPGGGGGGGAAAGAGARR